MLTRTAEGCTRGRVSPRREIRVSERLVHVKTRSQPPLASPIEVGYTMQASPHRTGAIAPQGTRLDALVYPSCHGVSMPPSSAPSKVAPPRATLTYQPVPGWGQLPPGWSLVEAIGAATDSRDRVYVFNRGEHP